MQKILVNELTDEEKSFLEWSQRIFKNDLLFYILIPAMSAICIAMAIWLWRIPNPITPLEFVQEKFKFAVFGNVLILFAMVLAFFFLNQKFLRIVTKSSIQQELTKRESKFLARVQKNNKKVRIYCRIAIIAFLLLIGFIVYAIIAWTLPGTPVKLICRNGLCLEATKISMLFVSVIFSFKLNDKYLNIIEKLTKEHKCQ